MSSQNKKPKNRLLSFLGYVFGCCLVGMALEITNLKKTIISKQKLKQKIPLCHWQF
jgi:hypothetical protein